MDSVRSAIEHATSLQLRIRDCRDVLRHAEGFANRRWLKEKGYFRDIEGQFPTAVHTVNTSTATAILARNSDIFRRTNILAFDSFNFSKICRFYLQQYQRQEGSRSYWPSKDTHRWSPYVSSLALTAIAESAISTAPNALEKTIQQDEFEELGAAISEQTSELQEYLRSWARHSLRKDDADYDHAFFAYTAWVALAVLHKAGYNAFGHRDKDELMAKKEVEELLVTRFKLEFYSQMTFKLAAIPQHLDAITLILSVYCLGSLVREREYLPSDVLDSALDTVFSLQQSTGFWSTSMPLLGVATGRVGCSSVELAICLLKIPRVTLRFEHCQPFFDRLFNQLFKDFDIMAPERGWSVDIRRDGNARQTWYSFMAYEFVNLYAQQLTKEAATLILRGFRYSIDTPKISWDRLANYGQLKEQIETQVINPQLQQLPAKQQKFSIILFGPPGTGKTTIANALAHKLNWGMIEIGPGDFLANGVDGIFAQGDVIFQRLLMLDKVVVLFDEVDELVQARTDEPDKFSRFLTTYMLPWIQRLRDKASIVFIFATNRIEVFDPAIRRIGRFDLILPLGPPQGTERIKIMKSMGLGITDEEIQAISDKLPPQTTLGELNDAIERCRRSNKALTPENVIALVKNATSATDWSAFLGATADHATVAIS